MEALRYEVGPASFSDWAGLHRLLVDCFQYMEARIDPPSSLTRMTPETLRSKAESEMLVVVYAGDDLVGCGFLKETANSIYLGKLAVKPAYRKKGILRRIVEIASCRAIASGKSALELEARVELSENHRTFTALGFLKTAENCHAGYDRPTRITMTKFL
jgi:GNAT superfamily N-acetyltransferase